MYLKMYFNPTDETLLSECEVQTFRASGKGGQHVNKTDSAVRLKHRPTGIIVAAQQERSQYLNKQICLKKLREKIARLHYKPPKRIPTKRTKSSKERMLKKKKNRSMTKKLRARSFGD
jgi:protein subunit release factor B